MRFALDANILFSLCNLSSSTSAIVNKHDLELFSLDYALLELEKYKEDVIKKSGQSFSNALQTLKQKVQFISVRSLKQEIKECKPIVQDQADVVYLALAKHLSAPLWSNDSHLKQQSLVPILTTQELLTLLPFD
jgi:predicted nucleic acid-binding protein